LAKSAVDHCHFGYNKKIAYKNTAIDVYHLFIYLFGLENIESSPKQKNQWESWIMGVITFHTKIK
jgi:hypothetical protein